MPQAELAVAHILGNGLAGMADHGELKVVDRTGTVGGQMCHQAPLHQFDHVKTVAGADHMGTVHQKHRGIMVPAGLDNGVCQNGQCRMGIFGSRISGVQQDVLQIHSMDSLLQRQNF